MRSATCHGRSWATNTPPWRAATFGGALREMLFALRAVVDGALTIFEEKPGGDTLVRVEVEGESEVAG